MVQKDSGVPETLYCCLSLQEALKLFQTGLLTWHTVPEFLAQNDLALPRLLTENFRELRDIFFHYFMENPKSREVIARQEQWNVDIVKEFKKPSAGVFHNTIQTMVRTNQKRHETLKKLRLLSFFTEVSLNPEIICIEFSPRHIDHGLFKNLIPVTYSDQLSPRLEERAFLKGMFGPEWVEIETLYHDLFAQRPYKRSGEKESLIFIHKEDEKPLEMKVSEESLTRVMTSSSSVYEEIKNVLSLSGVYSTKKLYHTDK
tara:strand:+ start:1407 stop:2180 length:774 start_codon:yes stop_codon:yes gene_type:complete